MIHPGSGLGGVRVRVRVRSNPGSGLGGEGGVQGETAASLRYVEEERKLREVIRTAIVPRCVCTSAPAATSVGAGASIAMLAYVRMHTVYSHMSGGGSGVPL